MSRFLLKTGGGVILLLPLVLLGSHPTEGRQKAPHGRGTLYFFFSPSTRSAPEAARNAVAFLRTKSAMLRLRPILLVEDWDRFSGEMKDKESSFFRTVRILSEVTPETPVPDPAKGLRSCTGREVSIPLFDLKGLGLARKWGITRLPALVLVHGDRAHRAYGSRTNFEKLLTCRSK